MKQQSIDLKNISKALSGFFERYHTIIFFLFLGIGLAICMIMIVEIINLSSQTNMNEATPVNQDFDQSTIKRLEELDSPNHETEQPTGRTNPFVE